MDILADIPIENDTLRDFWADNGTTMECFWHEVQESDAALYAQSASRVIGPALLASHDTRHFVVNWDVRHFHV